MSSKSKDVQETDLAWPYWLLRYIVADNEAAINDAVWSVGGSPPYGGVSYEEAEAVYNLLEDYTGPGQASESSYAAVRKFIRQNPERLNALEVFRIHDRISSSPESYTEEDVLRGFELSLKLNHPGVMAYFALLQAQLRYEQGEIPSAKELTLSAYEALVPLTLEDTVYAERLLTAAENAILLCKLDGDFESSREIEDLMRQAGLL